jgi:hypothetical protein
MTDTVRVSVQVRVDHEVWTFAEVDLPEDGQFSMLGPTFHRLAAEMDTEAAVQAAARAAIASVAPLTEETA